MQCTKCSKPAIRQAKRSDAYKSIWGGKEWREYCLRHLTEQIGKYPLEIKELHMKNDLTIQMLEKAFDTIIYKNYKPDYVPYIVSEYSTLKGV